MDKPAESKDAKLNRTTVEAEAARGVIPAIATLAIDTAEIGATTVLGVGADVRTELARGVLTVIDSTEALLKSAFSVARRLTQRLDGAAADLLGSVERIVGTSASAARTTTRDAAQVATGAVNAVIAPRGN